MDWRQISIVMITLNAADVIEPTLAGLPPVREILVVDGGSTDATVSIAQKYGARVLTRAFTSFVDQKTWAIRQAMSEWVLLLDADERVSQMLIDAVERLHPPVDVAGYRIARRNFFLGKWIRSGGWWPDAKVRLFRRDRARVVAAGRRVHEHIEVDGKTATLSGYLIHESYRTLDDVQQKIRLYATLSALDLYERGRRSRWFHRWCLPVWNWMYTGIVRGALFNGRCGWWVAYLAAANAWWKYRKLWELERYHRPHS